MYEIEDEGSFRRTLLFGLVGSNCCKFDTHLLFLVVHLSCCSSSFISFCAFFGDHYSSSYSHWMQIAAIPATCPADLAAECKDSASDGWEGEFFPGIPKIKYEVRSLRLMCLKTLWIYV